MINYIELKKLCSINSNFDKYKLILDLELFLKDFEEIVRTRERQRISDLCSQIYLNPGSCNQDSTIDFHVRGTLQKIVKDFLDLKDL